MSCAPKFKFMLETKKDGMISQPLGKCTVFDENLTFKYSEAPCEDMYLSQIHNKLLLGYGYCLAGTSVTGLLVETYDPLYFVGTPGLFCFNPILDDLFLHPIMDEGGAKMPPPPIELSPKTKSGEDLQQK